MDEQQIYEKYVDLLNSLMDIINESQKRLLSDNPDPLFQQHLNFFIKAYLITMCTYLEAFLTDIAFIRIEKIAHKLQSTSIPHNIVKWSFSNLSKDRIDGLEEFKDLSISIKKDDLNDHLSGNIDKTINTFKKIGLNLISIPGFADNKDQINSIVSKRNKIIHKNDDASDVSMVDLINHINTLIKYMDSIKTIVKTENSK
ncbi:HEPN domain-containing protein [Methylomonas sp. 2BW1-5-20]|uniref:HEPN domain-containing protein n=1 Tax=Methylomonas sp. 2BW1-5-20 TaxID=3376686 RepID=UPI00404D07CD